MRRVLFSFLLLMALFDARSQCTMQGIATWTNPCVNGFYSVQVTVAYNFPPNSGQLIVTCCNGQSQTFNPPFQNSVVYLFQNIPANGGSCSFTATFTANSNCSITQTITNTPTCDCQLPVPTVNVSACSPQTNTYSLSGSISFVYPPNTGTLTISDCNGNSQVLQPPFVSPTTFNFNGIEADGNANCFLNAVFSAQPSCSVTFDYTEPEHCGCDALVGTFSTSQNPNSTVSNQFHVCQGNTITIFPQGDFIPPPQNNSGAPYAPTLAMARYACQPTQFDQNNFFNDPCFVSLVLPQNGNFTFTNNSSAGETFFLRPVTLYNQTNLQNPTGSMLSSCFHVGPGMFIRFLPEFSAIPTVDCDVNQISFLVSGSDGQANGTLLTASNLQPASASFSNSTFINASNFIISNLQNGDNYSFQVTDVNGCFSTFSGTFSGAPEVNLSYPNSVYCNDEGSIVPILDGEAGGTFSANLPGLQLNSSTGLININNSQPGDYVVTYQTPNPDCFSLSSFELTIGAVYNLVQTHTVCDYDLPFEVSGYTFTGSGVEIIQGNTALGCDSLVTIQVAVEYLSIPSFVAENVEGCSPLPVTFNSTTEGDVFNCTWIYGDDSPVFTDCNSHQHVYQDSGCFDVSLTVHSPSGCSRSTIHPDMICVTATPIPDFMSNQLVLSAPYTSTYFVNLSEHAESYIWNFGDGSNTENGFSPAHEFPTDAGKYHVTLIAINDFCLDSVSKFVEVENDPLFFVPNAFTPDGDKFNNEFLPILATGIDPLSFHLTIFNRWGEVVFESQHYKKGWDGTYNNQQAPNDLYIWQLEFRHFDRAEPIKHLGSVSLLR